MQEDSLSGKGFSVFGDFIPSALRRIFFSIDMGCLNVVLYSKMGSISLGLVFNKTYLASANSNPARAIRLHLAIVEFPSWFRFCSGN